MNYLLYLGSCRLAGSHCCGSYSLVEIPGVVVSHTDELADGARASSTTRKSNAMDDALSTVLKWKMDDADRERRIAEMPVYMSQFTLSLAPQILVPQTQAWNRRAK